jgi:RND family efflux transporter MFP subunit
LATENLARLRIERSHPAAQPAPVRPRRRGALYLSLLAALAAAGYLAYTNLLPRGVAVEVAGAATVYPSQQLVLLNATGYVVPQRRADVASKATGRLESLEVAEGSRVRQGQVIATLESQDVRAAMAQAGANVDVAKAALEQARAELKDATLALNRAQGLVKKRYIPQETYDGAVARQEKARAGVASAQAGVSAARAALEAAKVAVEYTLIRAPFDGVVVVKNANVGDVVAPFSTTPLSKGAVVSMADMDTLEVEADVSEANLHKVRIGQACEILLDALPDSRFRGLVHRIVPTVDRTKATVLVKVRFVDADERILPDMSAKVAFLSRPISREEQRPVLVVPRLALASRQGKTLAFVVHGDRVRETEVETGERLGDAVVVTQGLRPGDRVVVEPRAGLRDGSYVRMPHG